MTMKRKGADSLTGGVKDWICPTGKITHADADIGYLACAARFTKADSFIGLDFTNPGEGQAVCLSFKGRAGLTNHSLIEGGRDKN